MLGTTITVLAGIRAAKTVVWAALPGAVAFARDFAREIAKFPLAVSNAVILLGAIGIFARIGA